VKGKRVETIHPSSFPSLPHLPQSRQPPWPRPGRSAGTWPAACRPGSGRVARGRPRPGRTRRGLLLLLLRAWLQQRQQRQRQRQHARRPRPARARTRQSLGRPAGTTLSVPWLGPMLRLVGRPGARRRQRRRQRCVRRWRTKTESRRQLQTPRPARWRPRSPSRGGARPRTPRPWRRPGSAAWLSGGASGLFLCFAVGAARPRRAFFSRVRADSILHFFTSATRHGKQKRHTHSTHAPAHDTATPP
jgi:hypothetical protein